MKKLRQNQRLKRRSQNLNLRQKQKRDIKVVKE